MSVTLMYGYGKYIPILQAFKELTILIALATIIFSVHRAVKLDKIDKLVLAYAAYSMLYVVLPVGNFPLYEKLLAFKTLSFFPFIYFAGRLIRVASVNITEYFHYICLVTIAAAIVLVFEVVPYTHLQTVTGYADFNYYFYDLKPAGNYGLTWTFEIENGLKRFASFFANPLEHAASNLITLSALIALAVINKRIVLTRLLVVAFAATVFSVIFALSRASLASFFSIPYAYAWLAGKKRWLKIIHYGAAVGVLLFLLLLKGDLYDFIINSIDFSNSSSVAHLIEWQNGLDAIIQHPLGLGLGSSGRTAATAGLSVGGESQFIILSVQIGLIGLFLYLMIYFNIIITAARMYKSPGGKIHKTAVFVFLLKISLFIPLFTAEAESYLYISYIGWFFSGFLVNLKMQANDYRNRYPGFEAGRNRSEDNIGRDVQAI
ncbi:O-antigen ligase family protein [Deminuibacter soli]|nr:O-antigen ligase family protein [Deminuibacter soli]